MATKKKTQQNGFAPLRLLDEQVREVLQHMEARAERLETDVRKNGLYRQAKRVQRDLEKRAKTVQSDLEERVRKVQKDLEKRRKSIQKDMHKRRDGAYHLAGLATKAEVDALNRRLRKLNRSVTA